MASTSTYPYVVSTISLLVSSLTFLRSILDARRKPKYDKFDADVKEPILQSVQGMGACAVSFSQSISLIFDSTDKTEGIKLIKDSRKNFAKEKIIFLFSLEAANDVSPRKMANNTWLQFEDNLDGFLEELEYFDQFDEDTKWEELKIDRHEIDRKKKKIRKKWGEFTASIKMDINKERKICGKIFGII